MCPANSTPPLKDINVVRLRAETLARTSPEAAQLLLISERNRLRGRIPDSALAELETALDALEADYATPES